MNQKRETWQTKSITIAVLVIILIISAFAFFISRQSTGLAVSAEKRIFLWSVPFEDILSLSIEIPPEGKKEKWIKGSDKQWYFDIPISETNILDQKKQPVDTKRWGGGIPLILTGPTMERLIAENLLPDQLQNYGFSTPTLLINIGLNSGKNISIEVGDKTPGGRSSYIRQADSGTIYSIDQSWCTVLEQLVLNPPYITSQ